MAEAHSDSWALAKEMAGWKKLEEKRIGNLWAKWSGFFETGTECDDMCVPCEHLPKDFHSGGHAQ